MFGADRLNWVRRVKLVNVHGFGQVRIGLKKALGTGKPKTPVWVCPCVDSFKKKSFGYIQFLG